MSKLQLFPLAALAVAVACAGNAARKDSVAEIPAVQEPAAEAKPAAPAPAPAAEAAAPAPAADEGCGFARVHFDFDSAALTAEAREALAGAAKCIGDKKLVSVTIEGHCDERGTEAYNIALGQRRADAVRKYVKSLGVQTHIRAVSFGKAYPVATGDDEAAWRENRRAEFRAPGDKLSDGTSFAPKS